MWENLKYYQLLTTLPFCIFRPKEIPTKNYLKVWLRSHLPDFIVWMRRLCLEMMLTTSVFHLKCCDYSSVADPSLPHPLFLQYQIVIPLPKYQGALTQYLQVVKFFHIALSGACYVKSLLVELHLSEPIPSHPVVVWNPGVCLGICVWTVPRGYRCHLYQHAEVR